MPDYLSLLFLNYILIFSFVFQIILLPIKTIILLLFLNFRLKIFKTSVKVLFGSLKLSIFSVFIYLYFSSNVYKYIRKCIELPISLLINLSN